MVIEIETNEKVIQHFSFIHPCYENSEQKIYFSKDLSKMFEKLDHGRVFLYSREYLGTKDSVQQVKWNVVS